MPNCPHRYCPSYRQPLSLDRGRWHCESCDYATRRNTPRRYHCLSCGKPQKERDMSAIDDTLCYQCEELAYASASG